MSRAKTEQPYNQISLSINCTFCNGGPLECDCEDVAIVDELPGLEEALKASRRQWDVVSKLGRERTEVLLKELSLDREHDDSWRALESLALWA